MTENVNDFFLCWDLDSFFDRKKIHDLKSHFWQNKRSNLLPDLPNSSFQLGVLFCGYSWWPRDQVRPSLANEYEHEGKKDDKNCGFANLDDKELKTWALERKNETHYSSFPCFNYSCSLVRLQEALKLSSRCLVKPSYFNSGTVTSY